MIYSLNFLNYLLKEASVATTHIKLPINLIAHYEWALVYVTPVNYKISVQILAVYLTMYNSYLSKDVAHSLHFIIIIKR